MTSGITGRRSGATLLLVGALGGLAVAIYNFVTPLTGVEGTFGAGLVIFSTAVTVVAALFLPSLSRGWRNVVRGVVLLALLCTAAAGYFLHEWWLIAAMALALVGWLWEASSPSTARVGAAP